MPDFTVKSANVKKTFPSKDGKGEVQVVALVLTDTDGDHRAEMMIFPGNPPAPTAGEKVTGTLEPNGDYAPKFKPARRGGFGGFGGGGPRPEDPKKAAVIQRMHSQEMALRYCMVWLGAGKLDKLMGDEDKLLPVVFKLADAFDRDAQAARDAAS